MNALLPTRWIIAALVALLSLALVSCEVVGAPPPGAPSQAVIPNSGPSPIPSPAPPAPDLLARALEFRAIGDYAAVGADLSVLLQLYPAAAEARPARFYLAESYAQQGNWTSAAELLRPLVEEPGGDGLAAPALFWLARCHEASGDHAAAVAAYGRYRELGTPLEPYAALRQAEQLASQGQIAAAAAAYAHAARSAIARGQRAVAFERAITTIRQAGTPAPALDLYAELLDIARQPAYRARLLAEAAALAQELDRPEAARARLVELVENYPATAPAAGAADQLRAAGDPALSPAAAGRIYLAAERWADAVASLDAAIAQEIDLERGVELRRLRGLALRGQGDFAGALAALAEAGGLSPNSPAGRAAQLDWIQTLGQSGDPARAAQAYAEFAAAYPDDPNAPEALSRSAILRERLGDTEGAIQQRIELGRRYPQNEQGQLALHSAGQALFAAERFAEARAAYQILAENNSGYEAARGSFWAARAARAGGDEGVAATLFAAARAAAPASYYGARAAEELGQVPQGSLPIGQPIAEADWAELGAWLGQWPGTTPPAEGTPPAPVDPSAERARLLAEVGMPVEARGEWDMALEEAGNNPRALLALASEAHAAGHTHTTLGAAEALNRLAPAGAPAAPLALERLRFPTPYPALVVREARERGLDPRLLYALMRQESLFDPAATSWVGARGLAQVMPETGQGIAQNLGVTDFTLDDLYRPVVSVRFGAFYLGRRVADMEGSVHAALAAYNGGLGNAQRWAGGSRVADADLFTEIIDYPETQGYVKAVYGFYGVYQGLYAP